MTLPSIDPAIAACLRAEASAMAGAYRDALVAEAPEGSIAAIYVKGSSIRAWDTEVDYVPELSDVDIHVRLGADAPPIVRSFPFALAVGEAALRRFLKVHPSPTHTPRPQLFFLDDIERLPGYLPSPPGDVRTVLGDEYRGAVPADYADCRDTDVERFEADADFVLHELAGKVIDRPGPHLWKVVSTLTFRVAPAGPRLLTQLGMSPWEAWSLNRTAVVRELIERDQKSLASHYAGFYLAGWAGFRSDFRDADVARLALLAAHGMFADGLTLLT